MRYTKIIVAVVPIAISLRAAGFSEPINPLGHHQKKTHSDKTIYAGKI